MGIVLKAVVQEEGELSSHIYNPDLKYLGD